MTWNTKELIFLSVSFCGYSKRIKTWTGSNQVVYQRKDRDLKDDTSWNLRIIFFKKPPRWRKPTTWKYELKQTNTPIQMLRIPIQIAPQMMIYGGQVQLVTRCIY